LLPLAPQFDVLSLGVDPNSGCASDPTIARTGDAWQACYKQTLTPCHAQAVEALLRSPAPLDSARLCIVTLCDRDLGRPRGRL